MSDPKAELLETYVQRIEDIPTLPYIVIRIMDKIHAPEPSVEELADLVMVDQVLTTRMIRLVNSVFWGLNRQVTSVKEAIVYLGLREISNLVYSVALTNTFERDAPLLKRVRFWEHSFGCAQYSKLIAHHAGYRDLELAYLGGLLHDIGEVIIAIHFDQEFEKVVEKVLDEESTFYAAEEAVLGVNHTDFGSWLVEKWSLPEKLSSVIAFHHTFMEAGDARDLVAIVRLADLICLHHQLDFGYHEGEALTSDMVAAWRYLTSRYPKLGKVEMGDFLAVCNDHIADVQRTVEIMYGTENIEAEG